MIFRGYAMGLFEHKVLTNSTDIKTTPEKIWAFLIDLERNYQKWHPEDHILLRWIKGEPFQKGSVVYAEEFIHGKKHKLKFIIDDVISAREINFVPASRILRIYFPKNRLIIEPAGELCRFTTEIHLKVGWLVRKFASKKLEAGINDVKRHIKEEGENLKAILEKGETI
jgi:hypothetical protein